MADTKLEVMKPLRKPGHQEQEQAEHYRSHSEASATGTARRSR